MRVILLATQLAEMGYEVSTVDANTLSFPYTIPVGKFIGQEITLALEAPQFPHLPPPGLLLNKDLLPLCTSGLHPRGGIHRRNNGGKQWQYWSRPYKEWANTDRSAKTYLAFVRRLFDFP